MCFMLEFCLFLGVTTRVGLFAVSTLKSVGCRYNPSRKPYIIYKYLTATGCPPLNLKSHANPIIRI